MIKDEIEKFEALQTRFKDIGASDSDSEAVFHMLIATAINRDPVELDQAIDWDLYEPDEDEPGRFDPSIFEAANLEMNFQAWCVFRTVQSNANEVDIRELIKYCWRVDREEFEPQRP